MDFWMKAAVLLVVTVELWLLRRFVRRPRNLPPGPFLIPIIGNFHNLGMALHESLAELAKIHGPLMSLRLGSLTMVVVSSPATAQLVLQKHDLHFCNRWVLDAIHGRDHHLSSLVFLPVDARWRILRRICATLVFSDKSLEATQSLRQKKIEDMLSHIDKCSQDGTIVHIGHIVFCTNLNLLSNTFFSMDLGDPNSAFCLEFQRIVDQIVSVASLPNVVDYFPLLKPFDPQRIRRRMDKSYADMISFLSKIIDQRLVNNVTTKNDVLDALLEVSRESGEEFDRSLLTRLLIDLFIGGTDTTPSAIEWAMAELIRDQSKLKKAQAELERVIGKGNPVKDDDIAKLPYLQAVVKEALRLHPPVSQLVPRIASSDVKLGGFTVPKGSRVLVNVWAIGRDPSVWERPSRFEPERFLESDIGVKGLQFEFTPFGSGRRSCPGRPLASLSLHLILGSLIHSFDWMLEDGLDPKSMNMDENFGFALRKAKPLLAIPVKA